MNLQINQKFIVSPINGQNYINEIKVGDKTLIVNNSIENHEDVNRIGIVKSLPKGYKGAIRLDDLVITQHNVFRITYSDWGIPRFSYNHIKDDLYAITTDVIYLIIRDGKYIATDEFALIEPIKEDLKWEGTQMLIDKGIARHLPKDLISQGIKPGDKVAIKKFANYLFEIFNEKFYVMKKSRVLAVLN